MVASGGPDGSSVDGMVAAVNAIKAEIAAPAITIRARVLLMVHSLRCNRCRGCRHACFCHVLVFLRAFAAHTDRPDHFSVEDNRHAALQRSCSRKGKRGNSTLLDLILEILTRAPECRSG